MGWRRDMKICLDSPGGNYMEGVHLALTFLAHDIGTVVAQNNMCESACAIAFLGGSNDPLREGRSVSRTMHATAKLGFHAPALQVPEGNYSKNEVDKAYETALKALRWLSHLRSRFEMEITESLIDELLATPINKMHYVDTVERALRYKIDVVGINTAIADVQSIANNICDNAVIAIEDQDPFFASTNDVSFIADNTLQVAGGERVYYGKADYNCSIVIDDSQNYAGAYRSFEVSFILGPDDTYTRASTSLPPYASFRSDTLLASAFSEQSIPVSQFLAKARRTLKNSRVSEDPKTCGITNRSATITNVQNFTNLRQEAYLQAQIIGRVPLGASVKTRQPGTYWRTDRCAAACNGTNQNAIKQCIDNNDVWIEVKYNGRKGYLSRKFLEGVSVIPYKVKTSQQKIGGKLTRCFDSTRKEVYSTSGGATCDASDKILGDSTYKAFLNMGYKVRN